MQTLIIHMHGIGDMIMFSPTLNEITKGNKKVDLLVFENASAEPIINSKKINKIYYCNKSYLLFLKHIISLKRYNCVYYSNNSSPIKSFIFFIFLNSKKIKILSTFKFPNLIKKIDVIFIDKKIHKIHRNFELICKKKQTKINFDLNFNTNLNNFNLNKKNTYVGIHPGSNLKNGDKRWNVKKYFKIIEECINKKIKIFIFIGPYEKELKNNFEKIKSKYVELIYNQKFITVGSIINKLDLFISNETGLAHLSSALNIKTIVIITKENDYDKTKISVPLKNVSLIKKTKDDGDLRKILLKIRSF